MHSSRLLLWNVSFRLDDGVWSARPHTQTVSFMEHG